MTDASQASVGGALIQQNQNGVWEPLGYYSRHLPIAQTKWATYRLELLAAQSSLRHFINEVYGRHFSIWTDHKPLEMAFKGQGFQLHDPVAQRAIAEIGQFTRDIRHIAGRQNAGGDYLSRIPPNFSQSNPDKNIQGTVYQELAAVEGHKLQSTDPQIIAESQENCPETNKIKSGFHPNSVIFGDIKFGNSILYCKIKLIKTKASSTKAIKKFHSGSNSWSKSWN